MVITSYHLSLITSCYFKIETQICIWKLLFFNVWKSLNVRYAHLYEIAHNSNRFRLRRFAKKRLGIIPAGKAQNCFGGEAKGLSKGHELHFLIFSTRPALFPEHVETEFEFPVVLDIVIGIDNTRVGGSTRTPRLSFRASFRGPDDDDDAIALSSAPSVDD